ncbi:MAG TPA: SRPBCC family protein [Dokdonella sp.]
MTELSESPPPLPPPQPPESHAVAATRETVRNGWWLWVLLGGAGYGLLMRLAFGLPVFKATINGGGGAMLVSFLFLVPFLIGLWTVSQLPASRRKLSAAFLLPWAPTALFLAGTAVLAIEGSICIVLAAPIFLALASLGGLVAHFVLRTKLSPGTTSAFLMLPFATGLYEQSLPLPDATLTSTESIHIAAPPGRIWQLINDADAIEPAEMASGWAWRIGVPYPVAALTVTTEEGRVRKLRWQHGVHFDEPILDWDENRYIRWSYRFAADSIPPGALDEHVTIGGRYFDLVDTSYRLQPEEGGTRLGIVVHYRISTRFNAYAAPLGRLLVDDAAKTILAFYQRRAQAPVAAGKAI